MATPVSRPSHTETIGPPLIIPDTIHTAPIWDGPVIKRIGITTITKTGVTRDQDIITKATILDTTENINVVTTVATGENTIDATMIDVNGGISSIVYG